MLYVSQLAPFSESFYTKQDKLKKYLKCSLILFLQLKMLSLLSVTNVLSESVNN